MIVDLFWWQQLVYPALEVRVVDVLIAQELLCTVTDHVVEQMAGWLGAWGGQFFWGILICLEIVCSLQLVDVYEVVAFLTVVALEMQV